TQNRKETRCDQRRRQANGLSRSGQGDLIPAKGRDTLKGVRPPLEFQIVLVLEAEPARKRTKLLLVGDQEQPLRLDKTKRAQEHAVHYREDRGIGSDAERHRQN